jgi:hypothetical protein
MPRHSQPAKLEVAVTLGLEPAQRKPESPHISVCHRDLTPYGPFHGTYAADSASK